MINNLFVIEHKDGIHGFYGDFEKAKDVLKRLYIEMHNLPDYNSLCFYINVYYLDNGEYVSAKKKYRFYKDAFWEEKLK
jgi:hypothetical protein